MQYRFYIKPNTLDQACMKLFILTIAILVFQTGKSSSATSCYNIQATQIDLNNALIDATDILSVYSSQTAFNIIQRRENYKLLEKFSHLDIIEKTSVYYYTITLYRFINKELRENHLKHQYFFRTLCSALNQIPSFEGTVFRRTSLPIEILSSLRPDEIFTEKGFMSTTLKKRISKKFRGNVLMKIKSRTGKYIAPLSGMPNEEEVIFRAGTRFEVRKVKKRRNGETNITLIELLH